MRSQAFSTPLSRSTGVTLLVVLVASIFGPYVFGPIQTHHVAFIMVLAYLTVNLRNNRVRTSLKERVPERLGLMMLTAGWTIFFSSTLLGDALYFGISRRPMTDFLSGLESLVSPVVAVVVFTILMRTLEKTLAKTVLAYSIATFLSLNSGLALVSAVLDDNGWLVRFHKSAWSTSPAISEMSGQRYLGVFNQPAEAGLAYSLGAVLIILLLQKRPALQFLLLSLVFMGGFLSVSKIFILGGVLLSVTLGVFAGSKRALTTVFSALGLSLASAIPFPLTLDTYRRLLSAAYRSVNPQFEEDSMESIAYVVTAGRSDLAGASGFVEGAPFMGFGFSGIGGFGNQLDSAFVHVIAMGGILAFFGWLAVVLGILVFAIHCSDQAMRLLSFSTFALVCGAALGFEPLTANKAGTLVWAVISMFVIEILSDSKKKPSASE